MLIPWMHSICSWFSSTRPCTDDVLEIAKLHHVTQDGDHTPHSIDIRASRCAGGRDRDTA